ncbi:unnamed protein product [[Candida] boidinii]|uniref:Unnamed protein product n=1 Tax=Candida boidinii TaxID=5477 RepID=A0A9W6T0Q3_CANBO|nr:hypothetical protein B5S30_g5498 [[Candida] boidinii]OWB81568.1 hypothetical protein B5S33_g187 [[Candida] boidinii]GME70442.1 unnamed protein product [[Candida] boidinii]GMF15035.1 unnamed protein product [[Candida] boidinii]GMF98256.1 unnamed protein product [[Candida] boidinii]
MKFSNLLLISSVLIGSVVSDAISEDVATTIARQHEEELVVKSESLYHPDGILNIDLINEKLKKCDVVIQLNKELKEHDHHHDEEGGFRSMIEYLFAKLFPFGPAGNSLLATTYISGPPNFILALIPANINVSSLSLLVSFAIGGLLGDVFLHLLPQTFVGEPLEHNASFVLVDCRRNCILGLFIFIGFLMFFIIDKSLRILEHTSDGESNSHSHSHSHSHTSSVADEVIKSSGAESSESTLKNRKKEKSIQHEDGESSDKAVVANPNSSVKTSAYLNLISDFTHNITDGLAISASFYISQNVGCTTTLAVFFHEIPHEVGDFALLIQGGFTKWQAMNSQFVTAVGAYLGTFIGIFIQELSNPQEDSVFSSTVSQITETFNLLIGSETSKSIIESSKPISKQIIEDSAIIASGGLFGTTVTLGDLTLPFTAGGFLYIATVGVIPEVLELENNSTRGQEIIKGLLQIFFIFVGIALMFSIAWFE